MVCHSWHINLLSKSSGLIWGRGEFQYNRILVLQVSIDECLVIGHSNGITSISELEWSELLSQLFFSVSGEEHGRNLTDTYMGKCFRWRPQCTPLKQTYDGGFLKLFWTTNGFLFFQTLAFLAGNLADISVKKQFFPDPNIFRCVNSSQTHGK